MDLDDVVRKIGLGISITEDEYVYLLSKMFDMTEMELRKRYRDIKEGLWVDPIFIEDDEDEDV
jgi:hypothetical protein